MRQKPNGNQQKLFGETEDEKRWKHICIYEKWRKTGKIRFVEVFSRKICIRKTEKLFQLAFYKFVILAHHFPNEKIAFFDSFFFCKKALCINPIIIYRQHSVLEKYEFIYCSSYCDWKLFLLFLLLSIFFHIKSGRSSDEQNTRKKMYCLEFFFYFRLWKKK